MLMIHCKQWDRTDNNNRAVKCPTIAHVKERLTKVSNLKTKNWTEPERKLG